MSTKPPKENVPVPQGTFESEQRMREDGRRRLDQQRQQSGGQRANSNGKATESQIRMLGRVMDQAGMGGWGQDFPHAGKAVAEFLGRALAGPDDLSTAEASRVIDHFKELANGGAR